MQTVERVKCSTTVRFIEQMVGESGLAVQRSELGDRLRVDGVSGEHPLGEFE
jgi:hypothetical protein